MKAYRANGSPALRHRQPVARHQDRKAVVITLS